MLSNESEKLNKLPPGSNGWPLIGETISFVTNNHKFFEDRHKKYGPVFKSHILGKSTVFFIGSKAFTFFINNPSITRENSNPKFIQKLLAGPSLPMIDGEEHLRVRKLVLEAFTPEALNSYISILDQIVLNNVDDWQQRKTFTWIPELRKTALLFAVSLLLGKDPKSNDLSLKSLIEDYSKGFTALPINLPFTTFGRAIKARDEFLKLIDQEIACQRQAPKNNILGKLIKAEASDGFKLEDTQLRAEILHMIFASYSGISFILSILVMNLAQHPKIMDKVRDEVEKIFPWGSDDLNLEKLNEFTYIDQVSREVLRSNRINASTFMAKVEEPIEYNGYRIPKGWKAIGGLYTTMQDKNIYTKPDQFDPDRFSQVRNEGADHENSFIPQGGGAIEGHRCAGEMLVRMVMKITAVRLLQRHDWVLPPQNLKLSKAQFPLPKDELKVVFTRL